MARSLHVRLDDAADRDLRALEEATGDTASVAVREALRVAAGRRRSRASLVAIAEALSEDPEDRDEMRRVRADLDELAPPDEPR